MNTNGVKIHEEIVKRNLHMTKEDKIKGLEAELEYTRRELTKNLIDLREERERRKILEVICDEMEGRN